MMAGEARPITVRLRVSTMIPSVRTVGPLRELNEPDDTPRDVGYYTICGSAGLFFPINREITVLRGLKRTMSWLAGRTAMCGRAWRSWNGSLPGAIKQM